MEGKVHNAIGGLETSRNPNTSRIYDDRLTKFGECHFLKSAGF